MLIDCDTCTVRGQACGECVVNLLFGQAPPVGGSGADMAQGDDVELRALQALADAGFEVTVLERHDHSRSRLRLVPGRRGRHHAA
jgi:hypothetical protein